MSMIRRLLVLLLHKCVSPPSVVLYTLLIRSYQIAATMSDVKMNLTQAQYGFLISLSKTIPRAFSPSIEDDGLAPLSESTDITPIVEIGHGFTETVDLSPELANIALRSDGVQIQLKSSLELVFNVGTVYLEIFTATALDSDTLRNSSLAKFSLNETGVRYKMLSNGSMEAEVVVRSFTVHDTRTSRQTKFREMIPATSHGGHQFMISYNQSGGTDQSAIANVTIDSPKVIFALDPVMALLDYFMSPFPPTIAQEEATKDSVEEEEIKEVVVAAGKSFAFRINVVSPTIILLDDPERADSEAMILSISQVQMTQQSTLALSITKIGMFLCKVR
jgi:vacuolar protein sorting-associated protein 13A/C